MLNLIYFFLIIIYLSACISGYSDEKYCNTLEEKTPNYQLKRHLFCDYDPQVRPTLDLNNKTVVTIFLIPKFATYNDWESTLDLHLWLYTMWKDRHLTWTPSDFDGIDTIHVKNYEIWTPEVHLLSSGIGSMSSITESDCILSRDGNVVCVPPVRFRAMCVSDYTYWPYDEHNCTLQLGSWSHTGDEVSLVTGRFDIIMQHFSGNSEFKLAPIDAEVTESKSKFSAYETFPTISVYFSVIRTYSSFKSMILSPAMLLTAINLTALWLKAGSTERLMLSCVNVLAHILTIYNIHWTLPHTGNILPNILIYYNNSFILSIITLVLTCWLQKLLTCKKQIPSFLSTRISAILASRPGQILLMNFLDPQASALLQEDADDNSDLVNNVDSKKSSWESLVIIIGWITFIIFSLTYIIMLGVFFKFPSQEERLVQYY